MNIEIKELIYYDPVETSPDNPFVSSLVKISEEVLGRKVEVMGEPGATGAGIFIRAGIPAVVIGPGKMEVAHTKDEYIDIKDLEDAVSIYKESIKNFFS